MGRDVLVATKIFTQKVDARPTPRPVLEIEDDDFGAELAVKSKKTNIVRADTEENEEGIEDGGHRLKLQSGQTKNTGTSKVSEISLGGSTSNVSNQNITMKTSGEERVKLDSTGNFGIGTDAPESTLHVQGDITFSGNVVKTTKTWVQQGQDVDGSVGDQFGYEVATDNTGLSMAIAAPYRFSNAGRVDVYTFGSATLLWSTRVNNTNIGSGTIQETAIPSDSFFGSALSMSNNGNTLAVGGYGYNSNTGIIRMYFRSSVDYNKIHPENQNGTDIVGDAAGDELGRSIALAKGRTSPSWIVATGAPGNNNSTGLVKVYQWTGTNWADPSGNWSLYGPILNGDVVADNFGWSVSMSDDGSRVAVGAYQSDGNNVKMHSWRDGDTFERLESLYGISVATIQSLNGYAPGYTPPKRTQVRVSNSFFGRVKIYEYTDNSWSQLGQNIDGTEAGDQIGLSMSLSGDGNRIAIGGQNQVRVYQYNGINWILAGSIINGETDDDQFGHSVSLSNDGLRLTVNANGVEKVRVYNFLIGSGVWKKTTDISGEYSNTDFGYGVDMTGNGSSIVIGAKLDNGGSVKVYNENIVTSARFGSGDNQYANTLFINSTTQRVGINTATPNYTLDTNGDLNITGSLHNNSLVSLEYPTLTLNQVGTDISLTSLTDFGYSVATSSDGTYLAVGSIQNTGIDPGFVRIFLYANGAWSQLGSDISGEEGEVAGSRSGDQFGHSVSLSSDGTYVAIGAPFNDVGGTNSGRVRVYRYVAGSWVKVGNDITGSVINQEIGYVVSISSNGSIVAIGQPGTITTSGSVSVYEFTSGNWVALGTAITNEASGDLFGSAVSLSSDGTRVAIGAPLNDGGGSNAGHVRIYQYSGGAWTQMGNDIDGEAAEDQSGKSVSLSGDGTIVAIGAYLNTNSTGQVRVYQYDGVLWSQIGEDIYGSNEDEWTGYAISLSKNGKRLLVGAHRSDPNGPESGRTRLYEYKESLWVQIGNDLNGDTSGDNCGWAVALSDDGTRVISVSKSSNTDSYIRVYDIPYSKLNVKNGVFEVGTANLYVDTQTSKIGIGTDLPTTTLDIDGDLNIRGNLYVSDLFSQSVSSVSNRQWNQFGSDVDGEQAGDHNGWSVSISNDGTRVAIGAPYVNSPSFTQAGYVRVYQNITGEWIQLGQDIYGEGDDDFNGYSVSLSSDGFTLAVSSYGHDGTNGEKSGQIRVFKFNNGLWGQIGNYIYGKAAFDGFGRSVSLSSDGTHVAAGGYGVTASATGYVRVFEHITSTLQSELNPSGTTDYFGYATDIDGDTAVIGAYREHIGSLQDAGAVYVFTRTGSSWSQQARLVASDLEAAAFFGYSVSISGDTIVVGSWADDTGSTLNHGSIYIFTRSGTTWTQRVKILASDSSNGYFFGRSVSISGNTIVVGSPQRTVSGQNQAGSAYIFTGSGATWTQQAILVSSDTTGFQFVGEGVSISGDTVVLGTRIESAYIFTRSGTTWTQQAKLTASDGVIGDYFGVDSVSISGDTVVIGARTADNYAGSAYIFTRSGTTWTEQSKLLPSSREDYDQFGAGVSVEGNKVVIGAGSSVNPGSAYVFERFGNVWSEQERIVSVSQQLGDYFGSSVTLNGDTIIIGAFQFYSDPANFIRPGTAYAYTLSGTGWNQVGSDFNGTTPSGEYYGSSVCLSNDGTYLSIGAYGSNYAQVFQYSSNTWSQLGSNFTGSGDLGWSTFLCVNDGKPRVVIGSPNQTFGGLNQVGLAQIYEYSGGVWSQLGFDMYGENADDRFGTSVSLSSDGTRLAIGAHLNDGGGSASGHVRVFKYGINNVWEQIGIDLDGIAVDDFSGYASSLSGNGLRVAVGSYGNDVNGSLSGKVKIFSFDEIIINKQTFNSDFFNFGSNTVYIDSSLQRVGIGTTQPTSNLDVNGSVSKLSGTFKIPHPLPSMSNTHSLVHSFIEGPRADLIYRGTVQLQSGSASINIDEVSRMTAGTFQVLNRDVSCFTTNESNWDLVKGNVTGNILTIKSKNTNSTATVSWLVIGERQDPHMYLNNLTDKNGHIVPEHLN